MSDDQELHKRLHRAGRLAYSSEFHVFFGAVRELALIAGAIAARSLEPMSDETRAELQAEEDARAAAVAAEKRNEEARMNAEIQRRRKEDEEEEKETLAYLQRKYASHNPPPA
jgi:hypothetical protein